MNIIIHFIIAFTVGFALNGSVNLNGNETGLDDITKETLKELYEQDKVGKETPTYQFLTEELSNHHLNMEESRKQEVIVTAEEQELLARLVTAEAKGEPYAGKVAVAEVVLNRVEDDRFPDSVKEVIYEKNAFQPVQNNSIQQAAEPTSVKAVEEALIEKEHDTKALFFYNPETASDNWIRDRKIIQQIGNHVFAL